MKETQARVVRVLRGSFGGYSTPRVSHSANVAAIAGVRPQTSNARRCQGPKVIDSRVTAFTWSPDRQDRRSRGIVVQGELSHRETVYLSMVYPQR